MARIYIDPSTQDANDYATGGTNEEAMMRKLAFPLADKLRAAGHTVRVGGVASVFDNVRDSNAWEAEYHIALHTDAGGGHGCTVFYYTGSTKGEKLARSLFARISAVTDAVDRGVKASTVYAALNGTRAVAVIIEHLFHDCPEESAEMQRDYLQFAHADALGICDVAGGSFPGPKARDCRIFAVHTDASELEAYRNVARAHGDIWNDDSKVPVLSAAVIGHRLPDGARMCADKVTIG